MADNTIVFRSKRIIKEELLLLKCPFITYVLKYLSLVKVVT